MSTEPGPRDEPPPGGRGRRGGLLLRLGVVAAAVLVLYLLRPGVLENGVRSPRFWLVVAAVVLGGRLVAYAARRLTGRPRLAGALGTAVVVVASVALLAPSFQQRTLDEPLTAMVDIGQGAPGGSGAGGRPGAADAAPPAREVAAGALEGVGHAASGRIALVEVGGGVAVSFEDVDIEGAPGPYVHLVPRGARDPDDGVLLGGLRAERGSFGYAFPEDLDPAGEWTVLVWCRPFATPIAAADLAPS